MFLKSGCVHNWQYHRVYLEVLFFSFLSYFTFIFGSNRGWTWGLIHGREALCHWALSVLFFWGNSCRDRFYWYPHIEDGDTEAQKVKKFVPSPICWEVIYQGFKPRQLEIKFSVWSCFLRSFKNKQLFCIKIDNHGGHLEILYNLHLVLLWT